MRGFENSERIQSPSRLLSECWLEKYWTLGATVQLTLAFFSSSVHSSSPRWCALGLLPRLLLDFLGRDSKKIIPHKVFRVFLSQLSSTCFSQRPAIFPQRPTIWFTLNASTMKGTDTAIEIPTICVSIKIAEEGNWRRNLHKYWET